MINNQIQNLSAHYTINMYGQIVGASETSTLTSLTPMMVVAFILFNG